MKIQQENISKTLSYQIVPSVTKRWKDLKKGSVTHSGEQKNLYQLRNLWIWILTRQQKNYSASKVKWYFTKTK
jgi:hypothetical protein